MTIADKLWEGHDFVYAGDETSVIAAAGGKLAREYGAGFGLTRAEYVFPDGSVLGIETSFDGVIGLFEPAPVAPAHVFTHDGMFHADEVSATAVLNEAFSEPIKIVRTRTEFSAATAGDVVIDVTPRTAMPEGVTVADHHRSAKDDPAWQRAEGPRLASAGWAWRQWGRRILSINGCPAERTESAWSNIDRAVFWGIDAADNGELPPSDVPSYTVSQAVAAFNAEDISSDVQAEYFHDAMLFMRGVLFRAVMAEVKRQREYSRIKAAIDEQWCDPVLVLDKGGAWQSVLMENWDATDYIKVVVYPDAAAPGVWRIQSAPGSQTDPFAMRCGAPQKLRGIRADAGVELAGCPVEFIHPAGFIGGVHASSAEDAKRAAKEWIALSD